MMMLRKGISGIVSNNMVHGSLCEVIRKVYSGDIWIRREILNAIVESDLHLNVPKDSNEENQQLTKREKEILTLIGKGCSNPKIAQRLFISETTVKTHISHVYKKMNIHTRLEAIIHAKKSTL
jgi:DNA-binding NarL/FixJ family response regulator